MGFQGSRGSSARFILPHRRVFILDIARTFVLPRFLKVFGPTVRFSVDAFLFWPREPSFYQGFQGFQALFGRRFYFGKFNAIGLQTPALGTLYD